VRSGQYHMAVTVNVTALFCRIAAPEQKYQAITACVQFADDAIGKTLPALALMGTSLSPLNREYGIEQEHSLIGPVLQIAAGRGLRTQVLLNFLIDIDQGRRNSHSVHYGKTQAMGLPWTMVRILTENYDLYFRERCRIHRVENLTTRRVNYCPVILPLNQKLPQVLHKCLLELSRQPRFPRWFQSYFPHFIHCLDSP